MKVFLDANVILDFMMAREPFGEEAAQVFALIYGREIEAVAAANSFVIAFFYLKKRPISAKQLKHDIAIIRQRVDCVDLGAKELDRALASDLPQDLEDRVQIELALKSGADIFLTNDRRLSRTNRIRVMSPRRFISDFYA